jgi:very-short-patch-repair endonuclease
MLNVAFTRAREEIHIFHSAPIEEFGNAAGKGTILDWLKHCNTQVGPERLPDSSFKKAQSEFEAEVSRELQSKGAKVICQYPSCGFFIDLVAEFPEQRLAIECDGEIWHLDEHGHLKAEDVYRQEILERAGWKVIRIPYRSWKKDRITQINRVMDASRASTDGPLVAAIRDNSSQAPLYRQSAPTLRLNKFEAAMFHAIKDGARDQDQALRAGLRYLGLSRLGPRVRASLLAAVESLRAQKVISNEEGELFIIEGFSNASLTVTHWQQPARRRAYRRRW